MLYRHVVYIMPQYPPCSVVGTSSGPPLARGEVGGTQTWISYNYWLRLEVRGRGRDVLKGWTNSVDYGMCWDVLKGWNIEGLGRYQGGWEG